MFSSRVYVSVYKKMRKEAVLVLIDQHPPLSIYPINQKMINTMTFLTSLSQNLLTSTMTLSMTTSVTTAWIVLKMKIKQN